MKLAHRLTLENKKKLARWAAACAERVLPHFEKECPDDDRPRKAIQTGRAWAQQKLHLSVIRSASLAAHAAARGTDHPAARPAARAAGQAAAVGHAGGHSAAAAIYALKAVAAGATPAKAENAIAKELAWQRRHLPKHLHPIGFPKNLFRRNRSRRTASSNI